MLTEDQAYEAMLRFLEADYSRSPSDGVGGLLGSLALQPDGKPADPAAREDWLAAVAAVRRPEAMPALKSPEHEFQSLHLHDARLHDLSFDWLSAEAEIRLSLVGGGGAALQFRGVTLVSLPREQPWGPSFSVNTPKDLGGGRFEIEMQSGDTIQVQAQGWSLHVERAYE